MKIRKAELKTMCGYTSTLPESELPEIAFAGRSNVGKSSLINTLMQRKRLARVGETPGKTRTINFYEIDALVKMPNIEETDSAPDGSTKAEKTQGGNADPAAMEKRTDEKMLQEKSRIFQLVDLPGYGYASVSRSEKEKWGKMIERYLRSERDLRAVFLLVDIRHEPNANDRQMYDWILQSGHTPVLIATKADKIKRSQLQKQMKILREGLKAPKGTKVYPFSALSGSGRDKICQEIAGLLEEGPN